MFYFVENWLIPSRFLLSSPPWSHSINSTNPNLTNNTLTTYQWQLRNDISTILLPFHTLTYADTEYYTLCFENCSTHCQNFNLCLFFALQPYVGYNIMHYEFWKGVNIRIVTKNIQVYLNHSSLKCQKVIHQGDFNLNDQLPGDLQMSIKTLCLPTWRINHRFRWKRLLRVSKLISELTFAI